MARHIFIWEQINLTQPIIGRRAVRRPVKTRLGDGVRDGKAAGEWGALFFLFLQDDGCARSGAVL